MDSTTRLLLLVSATLLTIALAQSATDLATEMGSSESATPTTTAPTARSSSTEPSPFKMDSTTKISMISGLSVAAAAIILLSIGKFLHRRSIEREAEQLHVEREERNARRQQKQAEKKLLTVSQFNLLPIEIATKKGKHCLHPSGQSDDVMLDREEKEIETTIRRESVRVEPDTCPICLEDIEEHVKLVFLPCGHAYHVECVKAWLTQREPVCPVCRECVLDKLPVAIQTE